MGSELPAATGSLWQFAISNQLPPMLNSVARWRCSLCSAQGKLSPFIRFFPNGDGGRMLRVYVDLLLNKAAPQERLDHASVAARCDDRAVHKCRPEILLDYCVFIQYFEVREMVKWTRKAKRRVTLDMPKFRRTSLGQATSAPSPSV